MMRNLSPHIALLGWLAPINSHYLTRYGIRGTTFRVIRLRGSR